MKNVCLYIAFLLIGYNSFGQGVDVIFWIDNSNTMMSKGTGTQNREYEDLYITVQNLMTNVLACNSNNRVGVVQFSYRNYKVVGTAEERPRIYIEGDGTFKNTAFTFSRRFSEDAGYSFACLDVLNNVLSGIPNPTTPARVYGSQTLTRTPGNKLIVCMITDAVGGYSFNDLIPRHTSGNTAYASYSNFKNAFGAKFVVAIGPGSGIAHGGLNDDDKRVAATIASRVGDYNGIIDSYPNDPDGMGLTGRKLILLGDSPNFYNDANFLLDSTQLQTMTNYICMESEPICHTNLVLYSPDYNVVSNQTQLRQASNSITSSNIINNGALAIYHAGEDVVLKSGFHSANGSKFRGYIEDCTGQFLGRMAIEENQSNELTIQKEEKEFFLLSPNPASDKVVLSSDRIMTQLEIKSLTGTVFFSKTIKDKSHELNISHYPKGFYIVTVITESGEIGVKKLIKN